MTQFIGHDGCERELMLLQAFVPDMVEAGGGAAEREMDNELEVDEKPPEKSVYNDPQPRQSQPGPRPRGAPADQYVPPTNQGGYDAYRQQPYPDPYAQSNYQDYRQAPAQAMPKGYGEPHYVRPYEPAPQYATGGPGDR